MVRFGLTLSIAKHLSKRNQLFFTKPLYFFEIYVIISELHGPVAQLGAHYIRIVGVVGSNPIRSTMQETSFVYQDKGGFLHILKNSVSMI